MIFFLLGKLRFYLEQEIGNRPLCVRAAAVVAVPTGYGTFVSDRVESVKSTTDDGLVHAHGQYQSVPET